MGWFIVVVEVVVNKCIHMLNILKTADPYSIHPFMHIIHIYY